MAALSGRKRRLFQQLRWNLWTSSRSSPSPRPQQQQLLRCPLPPKLRLRNLRRQTSIAARTMALPRRRSRRQGVPQHRRGRRKNGINERQATRPRVVTAATLFFEGNEKNRSAFRTVRLPPKKNSVLRMSSHVRRMSFFMNISCI